MKVLEVALKVVNGVRCVLRLLKVMLCMLLCIMEDVWGEFRLLAVLE